MRFDCNKNQTGPSKTKQMKFIVFTLPKSVISAVLITDTNFKPKPMQNAQCIHL